jgi:hypothetical protein
MRTLCIGGSHDGLTTEETEKYVRLPGEYQRHRIVVGTDAIDIYVAAGMSLQRALIKLVSQYESKNITRSFIIGTPDPHAAERPHLIADEWERRQEIEAKLGGISGDWAGRESRFQSNSTAFGDPSGPRRDD